MENAKAIKRLEVSLACLLPLIVLVMRLLDGYFRTSISNYAYSEYSYVYVFMLTLGGSMFLYNGTANQKHWYNIVLGISLFGVALTPHKDFMLLHYFFAGTFFLGSILAIGLSTSLWLRDWKYLVAGIAFLGLLFHFAFGYFSLLVAESIGLVPFSFHFIVKSLKK